MTARRRRAGSTRPRGWGARLRLPCGDGTEFRVVSGSISAYSSLHLSHRRPTSFDVYSSLSSESTLLCKYLKQSVLRTLRRASYSPALAQPKAALFPPVTLQTVPTQPLPFPEHPDPSECSSGSPAGTSAGWHGSLFAVGRRQCCTCLGPWERHRIK